MNAQTKASSATSSRFDLRARHRHLDQDPSWTRSSRVWEVHRYRSRDDRLPSIVAGELMVGALKGNRSSGLVEVEEFLSRHAILSFGEAEFRIYARIRARLETGGNKVGPNDLIVAATALAAGATLVTHNVREFSRVPGLGLVDWQV